MAFVVARSDSPISDRRHAARAGRRSVRYEIRESISTPKGPRARTLATFRVLTAEVLADAAGRALRPFDAEVIRARAAALGAPEHSNGAATSASALLARLRDGDRLPPALASELRRALPRKRAEVPDSLESALDWVGVDDTARGRALRDLLEVASRVPAKSRASASSFPRISSVDT
jgi:hypothetical protein